MRARSASSRNGARIAGDRVADIVAQRLERPVDLLGEPGALLGNPERALRDEPLLERRLGFRQLHLELARARVEPLVAAAQKGLGDALGVVVDAGRGGAFGRAKIDRARTRLTRRAGQA